MGEWNSATIIPTARQIAAHMPDGWTAAAPDSHDNGAYLIGPDNVQVQITRIPSYSGSGDRYDINGRPTREESKQAGRYSDKTEYPAGRKGITVSAAKTPQQIARDITNRLLPGYLPYLAALRDRACAANEHEDRVITFRDELLTAIGDAGQPHDDHDIYLTVDDGYGVMRVQDGNVTFERLTVPGDLALEIAAVLAEGARKHSGK